MVILKHLTTENFRILRDVDLHFPQRGSILIQGPNEAGKSALFESIYFALYGELLTSDHSEHTLDELIFYGVSHARVMLTFSVRTIEITIVRTIERHKGQQATLSIREKGMSPESSITDLQAVNTRIAAELGYINGEALRNSCFVEQKGLGRLEQLTSPEREATLHKLVGLEKVKHMTAGFKVTEHDGKLLHESTERLKLAEIQAHIPELSLQLSELEASLNAYTISENLATISQQEAEITEQKCSLEDLEIERSKLKERQHRLQQLKKAEVTLRKIITLYDGMARAQQKLPELQWDMMRLERREREELPVVEKRVRELSNLTHSFRTLERLSGDLFATVKASRELEQEVGQNEKLQDEEKEVDQRIVELHADLALLQQSHVELNEQYQRVYPELQAHLQRLQTLFEHIKELHQHEEAYMQMLMHQIPAKENSIQIEQVQRELHAAQHNVASLEEEVQAAQQKTDMLDEHQRQLSISQLLEEWQTLHKAFQVVAEAEEHIMVAHQRQERLTHIALAARRTVRRWVVIATISILLILLFGAETIYLARSQPYFAIGLGVTTLLILILIVWIQRKYTNARRERQVADLQVQSAISQVGLMVAARETAVRDGGNDDERTKVEEEIQALGGNVPLSPDEAQNLIQQLQTETGTEISDTIQEQMEHTREILADAHDRLYAAMDTAMTLQNEQTRLEELRNKEGWDDIDRKLQANQASLERIQQEIVALATQEGLLVPSFDSPISVSDPILTTNHTALETQVQDAIDSVKQEIIAMNSKRDNLSEIETQLETHQGELATLLERKQQIAERLASLQDYDPTPHLEELHKQRDALRTALRDLQNSLRKRAEASGIAFEQATINNAEALARKELESLQLILGGRLEIQSRYTTSATTLREQQDHLSEHYQQLIHLSDTLGSWIIPCNPLPSALEALQTHCQQEIQEADEKGIEQTFERSSQQEGASKAKIELCQQESAEAREHIDAILVQCSRPPTMGYTFADIIIVWPLVAECSTQSRSDLEETRAAVEQELHDMEQQEQTLSTQLQTNGTVLDLEEARTRMEQQERSYEVKKRMPELLTTVGERLTQKLLPHTEYYMQQILPLLTRSRYHDVHLTAADTTKSETGDDSSAEDTIQLHVWDTAAGTYLPKSALSGGATDQLSLALRLAFAMAVLPQEQETAPGFLLLDEPLSSFDHTRMQSLADIATGEMLSKYFEQIFLISHSNAFDPTLFPYHIYMDGGFIVESNLPTVSTAPLPDIHIHDAHASTYAVPTARSKSR